MIPASLFRGGTSKGLFLQPHHLPVDARARDALILRLLGSPGAPAVRLTPHLED